MPERSDVPSGVYLGEAVVTLLGDGRRARLANDYGYVDRAGVEWNVPAGAVVDGASIPQPLWCLIGGPFEGQYRLASIIHDWYCDVRARHWKDVHRMFCEAMLTAGVAVPRARLMYAGVYWGGPRWSDSVVENARLLARLSAQATQRARARVLYAETVGSAELYRYEFTQSNLEEIERLTGNRDLTIEDIEALVDDRTHLWSAKTSSAAGRSNL